MLQIAITISGDKETIDKLQKTGQGLANMSLAMQTIGKRLSSFYGNEVFATEGEATGAKWKSLNPKYKIYRATGHTTLNKKKQRPAPYGEAHKDSINKILWRTGAMKKEMDYDFTKNSATIKNNSPYFKYHQTGTRNMPQRPVFRVDNTVKNIVYDIVDTYVKDQIAKAGL